MKISNPNHLCKTNCSELFFQIKQIFPYLLFELGNSSFPLSCYSQACVQIFPLMIQYSLLPECGEEPSE